MNNRDKKRRLDVLSWCLVVPTHTYIVLALWAGIFALLSIFVINAYMPRYDHEFHLTRLVGLAQSIKHGDWLPSLNHLFSHGTGYASSMFYGNWQFYLPALFYLLTNNATIAYTIFGFLLILLTVWSSYYFLGKVTKKKRASFLVALIVPCFFPAYGFGMTMVVGFVPALMYAIYKVIYEDRKNPILLAVIIGLLIQTHLISTLVLAISSALFVLFNGRRLTVKKLLSFASSAVLGLSLSSGFIIQYLEQTSSQHFFFQWSMRNFPVPSEVMFKVKESFSTGFSSLTNYFQVGMILAVFYFFIRFKTCRPLTKILLLVVTTTYLMMTSLLPWETQLRYTVLGAIQYTERLAYFLPVLILIILVLEVEVAVLKNLVMSIFLSYVFFIVWPTTITRHDQSLQLMRDSNAKMAAVVADAKQVFVDPIGDEYYTLDINNLAVRTPEFAQFSELRNLDITDIHYDYNQLSFTANLLNPDEEGSVVLPKIWYKGYLATYSQGAAGSQPDLAVSEYTPAERDDSQHTRKPIGSKKVLHDGKIFLTITQSGIVTISYQKTFLQRIGYALTGLAWISLIFIVCYQKINLKSRSNVI